MWLLLACTHPDIDTGGPEDSGPTDTATPAGVLVVDPAQPAFGDVHVGCPIELDVVLSNGGDAYLRIHDVDVEDDPAFVLHFPDGVEPYPLTLGPAESTSFVLAFAPGAGGDALGTLVIEADDVVEVPLTGTGLAEDPVTQTWPGDDVTRSYVLPGLVNPLTLVVQLDGVITGRWIWRGEENAVVLDTPPPTGVTLSIEWTPLVACE